MHLKSITLKGFKSFPDRVRLDFGPGVSVIVGPNGSGKSNVTDAVLWALGEQSPLAVRGQTMQDVVFAGGQGVKGRDAAEVEVVIDNADGRLQTEFSEIAIARRLDRSGEGSYRLNGARCRLVDVLEVLSDSGLGKEMHSVISQGKVEAIVHSKATDRTAMIEEAAGLTKHRKRRHRAQLKLRRTQDNLDRALDVEREARSRLRPLKRQAEAAELHARLERQLLESRGALTADKLRGARSELAAAEEAALIARAERDRVETELLSVAKRREQIEEAFTEQGRRREQTSARLFSARSAGERLAIRGESAGQSLIALQARIERSQRALGALEDTQDGGTDPGGSRLAALEADLERLEAERLQRIDGEIAGLEDERAGAERGVAAALERIAAAERALEQAATAAADARSQREAAAAQAAEATRRESAVELDVQRIGERLRLVDSPAGAESVSELVEVEPGLEAALAAALGGRLGARVVATLAEGERVVEQGSDGGRALVREEGAVVVYAGHGPPFPGAERLLDFVRPRGEAEDAVRSLLADAWVVPSITELPEGFTGIAVTRSGTAYDGRSREVRRQPDGAAERTLADRNRLVELRGRLEEARAARVQAQAAIESAAKAAEESERRRELVEAELRDLRREQAEAAESERRAAWLIEQRRTRGGGPEEARRAELSGEIAAERRMAERLERERAERRERRLRLKGQVEWDSALRPRAEALLAAMDRARAILEGRQTELEQQLAAGESAGERVAAELRELAQREYELQAALRESGESLTQQEVRTAQDRDRADALTAELSGIGERLGIELSAAPDPLSQEELADLEARVERLERRRERLGPVNPLAEQEYEDALAHVEELETQRKDLEEALAELRSLIRETDRRIRESFDETFEQAARNFEDVVTRLFPGGSGRLRRVSAQRPRPVIGGEEGGEQESQPDGVSPFAGEAPEGDTEEPQQEASEAGPDPDAPGVEIEVTPAGKTTRRLSLLSGGEKSLVALAFMFAVFLARPCPFYILDEVEAALDDTNIGRFLDLIHAYSDRAQFIVITHQRRTMEAADYLYGVSMGKDGVSKVVSRRLEREPPAEADQAGLTQAA
jgi:chromosome segregation protein